MSLEMITSFLQPNGTMPKSAFTVIKKPDNAVEMVTTSEDKAVQASVEHINELVSLHKRISTEGMSRAAVEELQRIAPSAVPSGYGLEAFTVLPTNVMLREGLESITNTVLTGLWKLIKFLIEKLKAGMNILLDSYKVLTGISPSAYKLAKQQVYNELMTEKWKQVMKTNLDEAVLEALQSNAIDQDSATMVLDGFFNDSSEICDNLFVFEPLITQLQRSTEDLMVESARQQGKYNSIDEEIKKGNVSDEDYRKYAMALSGMLNSDAFAKISRQLDQLAKKALDSKLYKPDDKTKKSIVDRLRSNEFREVLVGLQEACRSSKPLVLKPTEAYIAAQVQNFDGLVNQLKNFTPVDVKSSKDYRAQVERMRVYQQYAGGSTSERSGFETIQSKFLQQQNDVKAVVDLVRNLTAQYAETVFKMTAFRNRIRQVTIIRLVAVTPEEIAMEKHDQQMDEVRKYVREWIAKATTA